MSANEITVVDYGIGNLFSVRRALEHCGGDVRMVSDAAGIDAARRLVVPGVGAFSECVRGLADRGLIESIKSYAGSGRPLLGICVGMQMLATVSEEFGLHDGLGLIPGRVVKVAQQSVEGAPLKIPHIGWTALSPPQGGSWDGTILSATKPGTSVYLVHSFHLVPDRPEALLAECRYGGHRVSAAVRSGNVYGVQFHPEKSGPAGLAMLSAFLRL